MDNSTLNISIFSNSSGVFAPLFDDGNSVLFPFCLTPIQMEGKANSAALKNAMGKDRLLAVFPEIAQKEEPQNGGKSPQKQIETFVFDNHTHSRIGTLVRVVKELKLPDDSIRIVVRGVSRIKFLSAEKNLGGAIMVQYEKLSDILPEPAEHEVAARLRSIVLSFMELASMLPGIPEDVSVAVNNAATPGRAADLISDVLNFSQMEKVQLLNMVEIPERLEYIAILLNRELEVMHLGSKLQSEVHEAMSEQQREFYLREQLRAIKQELNEETRNPDIVELEKRIKEAKLPEEAAKVVDREFTRLPLIPQAAPEYHISYNYITWILDLPWNKFTEDQLDIKEAEKILDDDHYGLEDVKKRILEFLAVLQLRKMRGNEEESKAPILCLIGPPGVGKTSLGQSIARALGRKFIRVSFGGVHDESEIRGHRRTYVGAMPGRIIQNMKRAGSGNPVFMLDEVDKLSHDMRGDPASALLEVLDPAQNSTFNDNYLELGYDLSKVFFIATANIEEQIPGPLRDRMEIIRLPGYTQMEKLEIAQRYLVKRELAECSFQPSEVKFTTAALNSLIDGYTMEAGVRTLDQTIARVCRRVARQVVSGETGKKKVFTVTPKVVHELLGAPRFLRDRAIETKKPGMATGMAWTGAGGVTLPVEVISIPGGKGILKITGSIGKVMEESAGAAFSLVRARADKWKIDRKVFEENDFHIHVPDGATPKDGPSAGVTLTMALISCLRNIPVRPKLAMTGEITLSGRVTAVGGIREKVIAAMRAGITDIIMPEENRKDYEELPETVKEALTFHFVAEEEEAELVAFPAKKGAKKC